MRVKYLDATDEQVRWANHDDPRGVLWKDKIYTVLRKDVHNWHTRITLEEFPELEFNSVCFEEIEG